MAEESDYKVGYGRPPKETQFKKGQPSANPRGRKKTGTIDFAAFFDEPMTVPVNGRQTKMDAYEVTLTNFANKAIGGDLRAAELFLDACDKAGLFANEDDGSCQSLVIPKDYDEDEWRANLERLGPPPWPGEHDGLPRLTSSRKPPR